MIKLTIISVVKNEEAFIAEMLDSLLASVPSFIKLEIIIIDDHSTDQTADICLREAKKFDGLKLFKNEAIGKVSATLQGLNCASSDWIKCIDGDDIVDLSSLTEAHFSCDAFYHDYWRFSSANTANTPKNKDYISTPKALQKSPSQWNYNLRSIPKGMFFFRRSLFASEDLVPLHDFSYEDGFINFIIAKNAAKINKLNEALYYYRQHENNYYGDIAKGQKKIERVRSRLKQNYDLFSKIYPECQLNQRLPFYISSLERLTVKNLLRLLPAPQLLVKALIYRVRARL